MGTPSGVRFAPLMMRVVTRVHLGAVRSPMIHKKEKP